MISVNNTDFRFSYAEVAFLRQYLDFWEGTGTPLNPAVFDTPQFCLLGGGITSPDNQVSHSEVFIRNYLLGQQYLESKNLSQRIFPVAWVPDDFGHSPQLPVLVEAMGMKAIGLSRVPGSPQPGLCNTTQKAATDIRQNGLSFYWPGRDGSSILTHFMPTTYYGIADFCPGDAQASMAAFLDDCDDCVWPNDIIFATEGGDWQYPRNNSVPGGNPGYLYDWQGVLAASNSSWTGQLVTFDEYYSALMQNPNGIKNFTLFAENYYTGYFASRPQLKINHYAATQLLLGAEVLSSIFTVFNGSTPDELNAKINATWDLLVPTTHHDFISGTACDAVHYFGQNCDDIGNCPQPPKPLPEGGWDEKGQLAMSNLTVILANDSMTFAMDQLSRSVQWTQKPGFIPVVVFNQLGLDLPGTSMVEMNDPTGGIGNYRTVIDGSPGPLQRTQDGKLLFQVPGMPSMLYKIVELGPCAETCNVTESIPQTINASSYLLSNGLVNITLERDAGWSIANLTIGSDSYVQPNTHANSIELWGDTGNLYQFGMEYETGCTPLEFTHNSTLTCAGPATLLENGPIRWRLTAPLKDSFGNLYSTQYELVRGETFVRITTTGAAPHQGSFSVLTSFPMMTPTGKTATALEYGTAYSWEDRNPQKSWDGLTFRATHNFAQLVTAQGGKAVTAVYHNGMPAWTIDVGEGGMLKGALLRNTPGTDRAQSGTDTDRHTQRYTLDVQSQLAETGYPLKMALYTHTPLRAVPLNISVTPHPTMPQRAQLAAPWEDDVVLAVAKTSNDSLVVRVQRANSTEHEIGVMFPWRNSTNLQLPKIVSALENTIQGAPTVRPSENVPGLYVYDAGRMLTTMNVPLN
ncbi:glycosyl hydrolases family 38 N-terminal domain-containing protein [Favolaschia claudopus]|uniref:Glycosyl hydrolases family 38 N-terminal domain-containing protein n=1 Tax=Favolaschia claudopus TaxID=2862362 RepID=A0AAW0AJ28_9AGAR